MAKAMRSKSGAKAIIASNEVNEDEKYRCFMCTKPKVRSQFYMDPDPLKQSGLTHICKECARAIALRQDENGVCHEATRESIQLALRYLNKPFIEKIYESSVAEASNQNAGRIKQNVWAAYIRNISMPKYLPMQWEDGDSFKSTVVIPNSSNNIEDNNKDILSSYLTNKEDAIRKLGYDPYEYENEADKPLLYSKLIRYLDASDEGNEDEMKISSIVEITKLFSQIEKINSVIATYMQDITTLKDNLPTIKSLETTKKECMTTALALAKDSGISLKHSNNNSKGSNTWTGKVKMLKELKLRDEEVNLFDIGTAAGMQQVAEISNNAILKQIGLNENDFPDMIKEQRALIDKYKKISEQAREQARLLLRENLDLKSYLNEEGIKYVENHSVDFSWMKDAIISTQDELGDLKDEDKNDTGVNDSDESDADE